MAVQGFQADLDRDLDTILDYAHMWNWAPDWDVLRDVYRTHRSAYSILTPFAYSYLEELIRSTTSQYGRDYPANQRAVGKRLIRLALDENADNAEYVEVLNEVSRYFEKSSSTDRGDNRNSTLHGCMHPRFWSQESFEQLIHNIALLSPFAGFLVAYLYFAFE